MRLIRELALRVNAAGPLAVLPSGQLLLGSGPDLLLTDLAGRVAASLRGPGAEVITLATDGATAVFTVAASSDVFMRSLAPGGRLAVLAGHRGQVESVALVPGAPWILSAAQDGTVRRWDLTQPRQSLVLRHPEGHVQHVAISADGRTALSTGHRGTLVAWDLPSGSLRWSKEYDTGVAGALALHPAAPRVFLSWDGSSVVSYDLVTGAERAELAAFTRLTHLAYFGDEGHLAGAELSGRLAVHDSRSGRCLGAVQAHTQHLAAMVGAPGVPWLATAGLDGPLRMWSPPLTTQRENGATGV